MRFFNEDDDGLDIENRLLQDSRRRREAELSGSGEESVRDGGREDLTTDPLHEEYIEEPSEEKDNSGGNFVVSNNDSEVQHHNDDRVQRTRKISSLDKLEKKEVRPTAGDTQGVSGGTNRSAVSIRKERQLRMQEDTSVFNQPNNNNRGVSGGQLRALRLCFIIVAVFVIAMGVYFVNLSAQAYKNVTAQPTVTVARDPMQGLKENYIESINEEIALSREEVKEKTENFLESKGVKSLSSDEAIEVMESAGEINFFENAYKALVEYRGENELSDDEIYKKLEERGFTEEEIKYAFYKLSEEN